MKKKKKISRKGRKRSERLEALMRIFIFVISGVILMSWRVFIYLLVIINLIYTLFSGKRLKEVAELSEIWNTQWYVWQRYTIFVSNRRPFPFGKLEKRLSKFNSIN
jgi:hypothetical protein